VAVTEPVVPTLALAKAVDTRLVTVKVPVVEPAGMDATRGTAAPASEMLRAIVAPPAGAGPVRVIVHVLVPVAGTVGGHCTEEIVITADKITFTLCEPPPYEAVTDPLWFALRLPVLIAKDPVVAFAETVTDPGTVSPDSPVLLRLTGAPLPPAAFDSVTVQFPLAFAPNVVGLHCSEERTTGASKDSIKETDVPLYVAVTVAF
jgi:hypothetical protein